MFTAFNVAELGCFTASGLIRGNDDRGDGFGKVKRSLNKKKRQRLADNVEAVADEETPVNGGVIRGNDEVAPAEQPVVTDEVDTNENADSGSVSPADGTITVKPSELNAIVDSRIDSAVNARTSDLTAQIEAQSNEVDEIRRRHKEQIDGLSQDLKKSRDENERLEKIFKATGTSSGSIAPTSDARTPNYKVNYNTLPLSKEPKGAAADFVSIYNNPSYTPKQQFINSDGVLQESVDTRQAEVFLMKNRDAVARDMERYAKAHGLLRGADASLAGYTLGTAGSIPDGFLPYLASEMRTTHHAKFIWWQFANFGVQLGQQPGQTVLVPKFENLDDATNEADFILDTAVASANVSADNQALIANTVPVIINGYGLGLGNNPNTRPVAIPEFIMATSMLDLTTALNSKLGHNYNSFEDFMVRSKYREALFQPNNIWYNVQSEPTNNSTLVVDGADGTMTEEFVTNLSAQMDDDDIPSLEDGCRIGVLSTKAAAQFKLSMGDKILVQTEQQLQDMSNILIHNYPGSMNDRPMQYMGKYCGFHMYQNLSSSKGNAGNEGVYAGDALPSGAGALDAVPPNTTAVGTTATPPANVVVRDSYFFGPGAVGKGVSMPVQIRQDDANQFGTKMRFIWREICGYASIDVSDLDTAGVARTQQNRVYVARTLDRLA